MVKVTHPPLRENQYPDYKVHRHGTRTAVLKQMFDLRLPEVPDELYPNGWLQEVYKAAVMRGEARP